ncbi:hypothetical protein GKE82_11245 [Conexibacter sp. W3-3-2]|uniref:choice-of-anchor Q domain-containing protein n=1 Tax=Conexibacter sp. W3-3-2 TaxID=2675227 RepID=UPI0012B9A474|nr:choice-of-anchor Q domain-containing protein [Conexibacter sp. W3-3-2]MTD44849.1 hypothetical protein [Conexibacter sp. W3-3-2]
MNRARGRGRVVLGTALAITTTWTTAAGAATIPVTATTDDGTAAGVCELREAVASANGDSAVGGCPAGLGADVITLGSGTYRLDLGALVVTSPLTIDGVGASSTTVRAFGGTRALTVGSGVAAVSATVTDLRIQGALDGTGERDGGAILVRSLAALEGDRIHVVGTAAEGTRGSAGTATAAGGTGGQGGFGGAIASLGTLDLADSFVTGTAGRGGVGGRGLNEVFTPPSTLISAATSGGTGGAGGLGGALLSAGTTTLTNVTVSGTAGAGGMGGQGGNQDIGPMAANGNGGDGGNAGAIAVTSGSLTATHVTVTESAPGPAGTPPASPNPDATPGAPGQAGTIAGVLRTAGTATFTGSILGAGTGAGGCAGPLSDGGGNLTGASSCPGLVGTLALGALGANGGPTPSAVPGPTSAALDGRTSGCPATDQRGLPRAAAGACDIGAVEVLAPVVTVSPAQGVGETTATVVGTVDARLTPTTVAFRVTPSGGTPFTTTARSVSSDPPGARLVGEPLSGLTPGTDHAVVVVATTAYGVVESAAGSFRTTGTAPGGSTPGGGTPGGEAPSGGTSSGGGSGTTTPPATPASPSPAPAPSTDPAPAVAAAPRLSGLSVRAATLTRRTRSTVRYRLDVAARTTLTIEQVLPGRRSGGRCVAARPGRRIAAGQRCSRLLRRATITRSDAAGDRTVVLRTTIGRVTLAPGSYRLTAVATAAGKASAPVSATFRVVAPRR